MSLSEIQIQVDALRRNVTALQKMASPDTEFIAVVKGNAYGHGLEPVVSILDSLVDGFQVDDIEELRAVRKVSTNRVLVLGYVAKSDVMEAITLGGELAIYDTDRLAEIQQTGIALGIQPKVHLKIDALLGRQGVSPANVRAFASELKAYPQLQVDSAYAHFANIEDTTDLGHAQLQIDTFEGAFHDLRAEGFETIQRHLSATSGLMTVENGNNLIRIGLGLYGMYPSASLARTHSDLQLLPVMRWVSHLAQVKQLPARHPVGYGLTYITPRDMPIGIVPQGYSDGYDRGLSSSGEVLVRGIRCSVLGRVAMNMFAVDLSNVPDAQAEDEVVLLGNQGSDRIAAEEIANRLGTINYEITTRITPLLPRRIV